MAMVGPHQFMTFPLKTLHAKFDTIVQKSSPVSHFCPPKAYLRPFCDYVPLVDLSNGVGQYVGFVSDTSHILSKLAILRPICLLQITNEFS